MFLEFLLGSISFRNPLLAYDKAKELAKTYWLPFVVTDGTDFRYHVEVFVPPPGHDYRTKAIRTFTGCTKMIFYPPTEPDGCWGAQTMDDTVDIDVTLKKMTDKAYLVELKNLDNKTEQMWIPKSQVKSTDCLAEGDEGTMEITEWIAKQKGLVENKDDD